MPNYYIIKDKFGADIDLYDVAEDLMAADPIDSADTGDVDQALLFWDMGIPESILPFDGLTRDEFEISLSATGNSTGASWFANALLYAASSGFLDIGNGNIDDETIDSNLEAIMRYFSGDNGPQELGENIKDALVSSDRVQLAISNLLNGVTDPSGAFQVDMTAQYFFVGDTSVAYTTTFANGMATTTFVGFVQTQNNQIVGWDSFSDPLDLGVELAAPYDFVPHTWSVSYATPQEWQ